MSDAKASEAVERYKALLVQFEEARKALVVKIGRRVQVVGPDIPEVIVSPSDVEGKIVALTVFGEHLSAQEVFELHAALGKFLAQRTLMSRKINAFTVVLDDLDEEEEREIQEAISLIRGVSHIETVLEAAPAPADLPVPFDADDPASKCLGCGGPVCGYNHPSGQYCSDCWGKGEEERATAARLRKCADAAEDCWERRCADATKE